MRLGLGTTNVGLADGSSSLNDSAADAIAIWNGHLDFISFSSLSSGTVPEVSGDGVNSVFSATTLFGDSFGEDTLAATVYFTSSQNSAALVEADVVVNAAYRFDSYRGPLRSPGGLPLYDLHRVLLHEFGHVLGLDHVTDQPTGQAIMEPIISDFDHLAADDIAGVRHLYGAEFLNLPMNLSFRVGDRFSYDSLEANNNPTSYSAIGLPPGISIDPKSGRIDGTLKKSGVFDVVVIAHGSITDAYGVFPITVLGLDAVPGLLAIIPAEAYSMVADPGRPRIYFAGTDEIGMIDTKTLAVTTLFHANKSHALLSISADDSTLLFTTRTGGSKEHRIDLKSLAMLADLPIPGTLSPILEGLNHRAYVVARSSIIQFDATSGQLQTAFDQTAYYGLTTSIAISPDRRTLFVTREGDNGELSSYDISGSTPILDQHLTGPFELPVASPDGEFLYSIADLGMNDLRRSDLPSLTPFTPIASKFFINFVTLGVDGTIYESDYLPDALTESISIFDPKTLKLRTKIEPNRLSGGNPQTNYGATNGVCDKDGKYFFAAVSGPQREIWVFSTDVATFPAPPTQPSQNLLNVSTRALNQSGEDAMIAGFIVQGAKSKKILVRGIGPSLPITGALCDPVLELYDSSGKLIASNDNWTSNRLTVLGTTLAPSSEREAAIVATLKPGNYTAIVRDSKNQPGLALVEVYDLDPTDSLLANISTRSKVEGGNNVMIGGFVVGGADPTKVLVRAIGPSLAAAGITQPLADPVLELHDSNGELIASNDNWRSTQQGEIIATGLQPKDNLESAIVKTLQPGSYTAIVRGQNESTGVALVEVYNLSPAAK